MQQILVTGGAGYIGSHMVRVLSQNGYSPIVFDNLSTGHREFVPATVPFIEGDLRNTSELAVSGAQIVKYNWAVSVLG